MSGWEMVIISVNWFGTGFMWGWFVRKWTGQKGNCDEV